MTNPFGGYLSDLSPEAQRYREESNRAGVDAIRKLRALAGLDSQPLPQINMQTSSIREMSQVVTGIAPAQLPAATETVMQRSPRDGREFNLFDASRVLRSYGAVANYEEDPLLSQPAYNTLERPQVGDAVPDRNWLQKLRRAVNSTGMNDRGLLGLENRPEEQEAIRQERQQVLGAAGEALVESANNIAQVGIDFLDTFGQGNRSQRIDREVDAVATTPVARL